MILNAYRLNWLVCVAEAHQQQAVSVSCYPQPCISASGACGIVGPAQRARGVTGLPMQRQGDMLLSAVRRGSGVVVIPCQYPTTSLPKSVRSCVRQQRVLYHRIKGYPNLQKPNLQRKTCRNLSAVAQFEKVWACPAADPPKPISSQQSVSHTVHDLLSPCSQPVCSRPCLDHLPAAFSSFLSFPQQTT